MSREQLVAMTRRNIAHSVAGTVPLEDGIMRVPASNYHDPDRWQLEMDRIFRRLPLVLGFSAELREPNSYQAMEVMGTPVLLVRGADGVLRSFVNMCSHRGAQVVERGTGVARRFSCPYHAWVYDTQGSLVGMLDKENFGEIDMSCHGLTQLPVAERAGIVFGGITPGMYFDVDEYLCGYGELLEHLDLANCTFVGRQDLEGPNWKLAYDGYLDFYHLPILHKDTFGPTYNNKTINDAWGPHQRNVQPDQRYLALAELPEDEWQTIKMVTGVWTIFPHISIASFDAGGKLFMISQLFPGPTPGTSVTTQNFLAVGVHPDDERMVTIEKQMDFLMHVVRDEDYYTGLRIQQAVQTGAKREFVFGRNEGPCQRFHGWVEQLVRAESPADTAALFRAAEEFHHP
ncbi:MAG: aromatic ring-hydroxylating dioxygenase subunit alpha [Acidimicrobiales bacterium]